MPKNIPVGNVWEFGKPIPEPRMERVKPFSLCDKVSWGVKDLAQRDNNEINLEGRPHPTKCNKKQGPQVEG